MNKDISPILITGAAGFIGAALCIKLLEKGEDVIGIDNLNNYYDHLLKQKRLANILAASSTFEGNWEFHKFSIENYSELNKIFQKKRPKVVVNLAAQAGVRYSIENPMAYIQSNLVGFGNLLEICRNFEIDNLIYASSSSVYGGNRNLPYSELHSVNHPISLYAATKKSNELMAHAYSHLYGIPSTGLRFFTVYGPWGRPDMAPMIFAKSILSKIPIKVFNFGKMKRDFTYIDDIVEGIIGCCYKPATSNCSFDKFNPEQCSSFAPYRVFNIGNNKAIELLKFIKILENYLGEKAIIEMEEMQPGDVIETAADTSKLEAWVQFKSKTSIEQGMKKFTEWFIEFNK